MTIKLNYAEVLDLTDSLADLVFTKLERKAGKMLSEDDMDRVADIIHEDGSVQAVLEDLKLEIS